MQEREWWLEERGGEASGTLGTFSSRSCLGAGYPGLVSLWDSMAAHIHSVHAPRGCCFTSREGKVLAFLPVPLGSSCQLSRHAGWSAWRWTHGSCPTMGLKGPQNKSLRGRVGDVKMDEEKEYLTISLTIPCSLGQG